MNLPRFNSSAAHNRLVSDCLELLLRRKVWAWPNKTQGTYDPVRKCFRKPKHSVKGPSDILGCFRAEDWPWCAGVIIAVEVKTGTGRLTPEQKAFLDNLNAAGGLALVVRDLKDLDAALTAWGRREEG